ncbi:MAG TPA: hypothetical protein DCS24_09730 [Erythrobacter sp.]|mgnify:CR=1 FL=1|nr:hypothetical protein [Erythrobacter sp.]
MSSPHDKAWSDFWARNRQSGQDGGCLPAKWQGIDAQQRAAWYRFAQLLPRNARVIDIATGDGRVMAWMLSKRRDLKLQGVDMAPELPDPPKGTKFRAGTTMESLPFPEGKFAAAASQFGFEYGDVALAAAELARVVAKGGKIALMTHRIDGPILEHNLRRREQINWVFETQDLFATAKRSLAARSAGLQLLAPKIKHCPAEGARLFGQGSAAWEISEAIRRTMIMGARQHSVHVAQTLDMIADQARNEIGRIASLEAACKQTSDETKFLQALEKGGLKQSSIEAVVEADSSQPFADFRILSHS